MAFEVVDAFEPRTNGSRYDAVSDGKIYKIPLREMGHKSAKNLSMALRSFAKRAHKQAKIQTGKDYVIVRMTPEF